jgi:hypothetical protein
MIVLSYMDGGIGSIDLNTGRMIKPASSERLTLFSIHARPGQYSDSGAYSIYEDEEDVLFLCVNHEFKFAKQLGVFFKGFPKDSSRLTVNLDSTMPFPLAGSSQAVVGKYIIYLNGFDDKAANWQETMHTALTVLDTSTGEYGVIASHTEGLIRKRLNAFSYHNNGYIYTFGGIFKEVETDDYDNPSVVFVRRGIIERYDLMTGSAVILPTEYSTNDMYELHRKDMGLNQIVQFSPVSVFGKRNDNKILANYIVFNDAEDYSEDTTSFNDLFFFDLVNEKEYTGVEFENPDILHKSAVLVCERTKTKELYLFQFSVSFDDVTIDKETHVSFSV